MKKLLVATAYVGVLGAASLADAGIKLDTQEQVRVYRDWRFASGQMSDARASSDDKQLVEAEVRMDRPNDAPQARLYVRDSAGVTAVCYTRNPNFVELVRSVTSDSYVFFSWNATADCESIIVRQSSYYAPKR